ncbi:1,2-phenylacetyl-CoA epoxidase subunit PaaC [Phytoactinopolyspora halotolerans]|uniref:Phenylacetate-CoA oxygenase subunit PaaC n=1 Tax=Phytoactinopolyspora halotolerans TaxID=1981512 RepID=A0A6L9SB66_9ACTN|nr:1,2-phenylacetyl-CoA epoxidase subunit PaaC [Phytoactinopolyspora halotolerans]NEE01240.1 phenylacetate-CoA oxygenase subunit PaaC [Phytoactinopolyspora halotolerans]
MTAVFDNAYEAIIDADSDARWAFGTGFENPLAGVDTSLPPDVDGADLAAYCLMLGDDALIMSHRLQQWCTRLPELEEEVAVANIGLDLLGQARLLLSRAGAARAGADGIDGGRVAEDAPPDGRAWEDHYAFFRDEHEYRNVRLAELENGDFGELTARLLVFSTWRLALLNRLTESTDPVLSAIAAKGVKEVTYHRDYAAQWTVRLGDGTDESHQRMQAGLDAVWPYVDELFVAHPVEERLAAGGAPDSAAVAVDPSTLRTEFDDVLVHVLKASTLRRPDLAATPGIAGRTGRDGVHTEAMGFLLAEMQSVARAHPEGVW